VTIRGQITNLTTTNQSIVFDPVNIIMNVKFSDENETYHSRLRIKQDRNFGINLIPIGWEIRYTRYFDDHIERFNLSNTNHTTYTFKGILRSNYICGIIHIIITPNQTTQTDTPWFEITDADYLIGSITNLSILNNQISFNLTNALKISYFNLNNTYIRTSILRIKNGIYPYQSGGFTFRGTLTPTYIHGYFYYHHEFPYQPKKNLQLKQIKTGR
jgi:hypothetical protein